ncbi:MAG TPA: hypothetical protein VMA34_08625 [Terracidiphilus sp.]|nr:hypothetical protein [Terracidiphilus sp.]
MKRVTSLLLALPACASLSVLATSAVPAFANVTIVSPASGSEVVSPLQLTASASACSSQPIAAMGYSFDNSAQTTIVNGASINTQLVTTLTGAHTLHVKSWGNQGASCVTSVAIILMPSPTSYVPAYATVFKGVQALPTWLAVNDTGSGGGTSSGVMNVVASPSLTGSARKFATTFTNNGGQRYFATIGANTLVSNFLYDGWVYIGGSSNGIANIEMDMNQVMANGETVIYGFQCDGWSNTWDYTANEGTPTNPSDQWLHTQAPCSPRNWSTNAWHHVQISYSRDQYGTVTYNSVWLDGLEQDLHATVSSAFALGWGSVLLTNFQVDGMGASGSSTVYLDNLTVYGW